MTASEESYADESSMEAGEYLEAISGDPLLMDKDENKEDTDKSGENELSGMIYIASDLFISLATQHAPPATYPIPLAINHTLPATHHTTSDSPYR